jgi:hypothetical protein
MTDLLEEEYKFCHQLLIENISILEKTEVYATGAIAASIVFSAAATNPVVAAASSFAPMLIAVVGFARFIGLDGVIGRLNNYSEIVASKLPEGGWTKFYRANKPVQLARSRWAIWVFLNLASIIFPAYVLAYGPLTKEAAKPADAVNSAQIKVIEAQQQLLISLVAAQQQKGICPTGLEVAVRGGPQSQPLYRCKGKLPASK